MFNIPYLVVPPSTFDALVGGRFELCSLYANNQIKADFGNGAERLPIYCDCGMPGTTVRATFDAIILDYIKWLEDQTAMAAESEKQYKNDQVQLFDNPADWEIPADIEEAFKR